ncbi:hypothetical protein Taro_025937, partial [Colocasia esculenta]|nr:hypothetical protein [Colocasia esculenta]
MRTSFLSRGGVARIVVHVDVGWATGGDQAGALTASKRAGLWAPPITHGNLPPPALLLCLPHERHHPHLVALPLPIHLSLQMAARLADSVFRLPAPPQRAACSSRAKVSTVAGKCSQYVRCLGL